jgi:general secretion pathway protein B
MSYILDALKKLEHKREREEPQRLRTFSAEIERRPKKRPMWPYLIVAILLLNTVIMLGFMHQWHQDERGISLRVPAEQRSPQSLKAPETERKEEDRSGTVKKVLEPKDEPGSSTQAAAPPARNAAPPARETTMAAKNVPVAPQEKRVKVDMPADPACALSDLPPFIRNELPEFKVSGHAYSPNPSNRVVRVNDKVLQEGQDLAPGLRVEEVLPEGIIFSYKGYRFRIGVTFDR